MGTIKVREVHMTFGNLSDTDKLASIGRVQGFLPFNFPDVLLSSVCEDLMECESTPLDCGFLVSLLEGMFNLLPEELHPISNVALQQNGFNSPLAHHVLLQHCGYSPGLGVACRMMLQKR